MSMHIVTRGVKAVYNFLVGDMRLLLGTAVALLLAALLARALPGAAGALLLALVALTLGIALRREIAP